MKKKGIILLLVTLVYSLSCQLLSPAREGTVISNCPGIVTAMSTIQSVDAPEYLLETGRKQGGELDVNGYFDVLTNLSMREGYMLDYAYLTDFLGSSPLLYAHPVDQAPYASIEDVPDNTQLQDFHDYVEIKDIEQGYFEYVVMDIMASQFYLFWHASYNDTQIVCNRKAVDDIISAVNTGDFGNKLDFAQQTRARALNNVEPAVRLTDDSAIVEVITFTKWGGFYRLAYTISRSFPHSIIDVKEENLVPYDCGVMF